MHEGKQYYYRHTYTEWKRNVVDQAEPLLYAISDLLSSLAPLGAAIHETPNLVALQMLLQQGDQKPAICLNSPVLSLTWYFIADGHSPARSDTRPAPRG